MIFESGLWYSSRSQTTNPAVHEWTAQKARRTPRYRQSPGKPNHTASITFHREYPRVIAPDGPIPVPYGDFKDNDWLSSAWHFLDTRDSFESRLRDHNTDQGRTAGAVQIIPRLREAKYKEELLIFRPVSPAQSRAPPRIPQGSIKRWQ
jgi:hypothetical protein